MATDTEQQGAKHQAEGNWDQFVGEVRRVYGKTVGDEMEQFNGNMQKAKGWLQERYGDAEQKLSRFFGGNR